MLTEKQKQLIREMPKAGNHIHIEGSIPWDLVIKLARKNKVSLPYYEESQIKEWTEHMISTQGLNGFMVCNRTFNSVCLHEEDYEEVILELAKKAHAQNIIYQEYHLDYPLNEQRGIPINVVMEGYRRGRERAKKEFDVDIVYIAGIDRTQPIEKCLEFVKSLQDYLHIISGLGLDCEEQGYPPNIFEPCYREGEKMGLFLTAHAGEDGGWENIESSLDILHINRIDHGCKAIEHKELLSRLRDEKILCAMCPTSNVKSGAAANYKEHPFITLFHAGVPVSISSDDPPYVNTLTEEYEKAISEMGLSEKELIKVARNAFLYSIHGQKYLEKFDSWAKTKGFSV